MYEHAPTLTHFLGVAFLPREGGLVMSQGIHALNLAFRTSSYDFATALAILRLSGNSWPDSLKAAGVYIRPDELANFGDA